MKILRLDLSAFGPFTNTVLDFDRGQEGLHIVYGPNEAGKSSALRALRDALYGIPARSADDFVHKYAQMRIGVTLAGRNGDRLAFVRRKGTRQTLLDPQTSQPLPEAPLASLLGAVERETFESMFGIDYQALVEGGRQITQLEGQIGQMLFSAAGGISHLRDVQRTLESEASELFKPSGSKPCLNAALREFKEAGKAAKLTSIKSRHYADLVADRDTEQHKLNEVEQSLREKQSEQARLQRIYDALPQLEQRRERLRELEEYRDVPLLRPEFPRECHDARSKLVYSQDKREECLQDRRKIEEELQRLSVSESLPAYRREIAKLPEALGSYRKAQADLPGLKSRLESCRRDAADILRQLRPDLSLDEVDALRLSKRQQVDLRNLGQQHGELLATHKAVVGRIEQTQQELRAAQLELAGLDAARDVADLKSAVAEIQPLGPLEERLAEVLGQHKQVRDEVDVGLARLGRWSGSFEELERQAVPGIETIEEHEEHLKDARLRCDEVDKRLEKLAEESARTEEALTALHAETGEVPTDDDLQTARSRRDRGWQIIRAAWESGARDEQAAAQFLEERDEASGNLAAVYEDSVAQADAVADRLRREAQRVAEQARLLAARGRMISEQEHLAGQQESARAGVETCQAEWRGVWQPLGVEAAAPKVMRRWRDQQQRLIEKGPQLRSLQAQGDELRRQAADARRRLDEQLCAAGRPPLNEQTLQQGLLQAAKLVERWEDCANQRRQSEKDIQRFESESQTAADQKEEIDDRLKDWRERWAEAVTPLGLPVDSTPEQVNEVLIQIGELFSRLKDADGTDGLEARIHDILRDAEAFEADVRRLAEACAVIADLNDIAATANALVTALREAETTAECIETLQGKSAKLDVRLSEQSDEILRSQAALKTLCEEAGCDHPDQLDECWRRSDARQKLMQRVEDVEQSLRVLTRGQSLEEFEREVREVDRHGLPERLAELAAEIERLDAQRGPLNEDLGRLRAQLKAIDTGTQAVEANAQAQRHLARIEEHAVEYARLRLAAAVLRRAIERFNSRNQGPMLDRAGGYFQQLTDGSFSRLRVDYDDKDNAVLVGVRTDGDAPTPITGMSEGTADQLYFALRLAYLFEWLERHEPLPLIVDDILIKFDDRRALATLQVLAAFSRRTQVILFTHHPHLVALAQRHINDGSLFVQNLRENV